VPTVLIADVPICWQRDSPITTSCGLLSGTLPYVGAGTDKGTLLRSLALSHPLLDYGNLQSSTPPTLESFQRVEWSSTLSENFVSQSAQPIAFTTSNSFVSCRSTVLASTEAVHRRHLLAIATGALVTLLTDVIGAVDESETRRNKRRRRYAEKLAKAKSETEHVPASATG
jgi:hypothetical protein